MTTIHDIPLQPIPLQPKRLAPALEPIPKKPAPPSDDLGLVRLPLVPPLVAPPKKAKQPPGPLKPPHACALTLLKGGAEPLPPKDNAYRRASGELFALTGPRASDVRQGDIGDCWLLAPLAALCEKRPDRIEEMIRERKDGRVDVRFYREERGRFVEQWITVTRDLPVHRKSGSQIAESADRDHDGKPERWVPIVEKAFALFAERFIDTRPGYRALEGGDPAIAIEALTGEKTRWVTADRDGAQAMWARLQHANTGQVVVAASSEAPTIVGIPARHGYAVESVYEMNGERFVALRNPWGGPDGPEGAFVLPFSDFLLGFSEIYAVERNPSLTLSF